MTTYTVKRRIQGDTLIATPAVTRTIVLDFGDIAHAAGDIFEVFPLVANSIINTAGVYVLKANSLGGGGTLSLGDGASTTRFVNAQAPSAANANLTRSTTYFQAYNTADTLDLIVNTATINAKILVWCIYADASAINLGTK